MLGLSSKVVITLDFLGEIYSSAAKNLDFMRVCESVVMNIGTSPSVRLGTRIFYLAKCRYEHPYQNKKPVRTGFLFLFEGIL